MALTGRVVSFALAPALIHIRDIIGRRANINVLRMRIAAGRHIALVAGVEPWRDNGPGELQANPVGIKVKAWTTRNQ